MRSSPSDMPDLSDDSGGAVPSSSSSSSYQPSDDDSPLPAMSTTANNAAPCAQDGDEQAGDIELGNDYPVPSSGHNLAPRARKPYTSTVRPKRQERTTPTRKEIWLDELETMTKPKFHAHQCCVHLKCYRHANYDYYMIKALSLIHI